MGLQQLALYITRKGNTLLEQAHTIRLVLSEEFLFDTVDANNTSTFGDHINAAHAHLGLTPWGDIFDHPTRAKPEEATRLVRDPCSETGQSEKHV